MSRADVVNNLILIEKPELPINWDYDESVKKVKQVVYKWKTLTDELAKELWIANKKLTIRERDTTGTFVPMDKNWSDYCKEIGSSKRVVNRWLARWFPPEEKEREKIPLPEGKYNVFYVDPPWEYGDKLIEGYGAAEHHYHSMTINEIIEYTDPAGKQIKELPAENAVLFLWVTSPILPECFSVIEGWGFKYATSFIWDKVKHNWGHYNSVRHEFLLICIKGSFPKQNKELEDSVISIERSKEHSEKPEYFRELIERMYPRGKWIELFARCDEKKKKVLEKKGWTLWGAQI